MLSYETAKKLKEAGFPQSTNIYKNECYVEKVSYANLFTAMAHTLTIQGKETEVIVTPTLEELIEACGNVINFSVHKLRDCWWAGSSDRDRIQEDELPSGEGSTPSEAVANLWLVLHSRK